MIQQPRTEGTIGVNQNKYRRLIEFRGRIEENKRIIKHLKRERDYKTTTG